MKTKKKNSKVEDLLSKKEEKEFLEFLGIIMNYAMTKKKMYEVERLALKIMEAVGVNENKVDSDVYVAALILLLMLEYDEYKTIEEYKNETKSRMLKDKGR